MTSKKEESESLKKAQERLSEIGQILCLGIKRMKHREVSKNILNQLDYTAKASVHKADTNMNYQEAYEQ